MRLTNFVLFTWIAVCVALGSKLEADGRFGRRQNTLPSELPTLGSASPQTSLAAATSVFTGQNTLSSQTASDTATSLPLSLSSGTGTVSTSQGTTITSISSPTSTVSSPTPSGSVNASSNATAQKQNALPVQPQITPALSIGGVVLILTGVVYTLIGVKNKWIHIFLSTAYLTSLSITVLIIYVMNPPVSNAIQGAYFVGILMTGIIFGAGALIFKEVTEGLGCLLGGFCLSMWFLTLKDGGLITSTTGKAVFVTIFCVTSWSLSFSHYTRAYGLMGSIAFSGATAFVLGIDCFSRSGLKEFWIYVWDLNDNVFPLNTNTYPITRGTRVETIVIILVFIVGIISQVKLWKVVQDRQKRRNDEAEEETRRREVVEAALGRHLERQNDRDRSQWEKQYGNRLSAKRDTILWADAHGEKGYAKIEESELGLSQPSSSQESLEMTTMSRKPRSMYVTKVRRQSMPVTSIPEVEEGEASDKIEERQKGLDRLEGNVDGVGSSNARSPVPSPAASPQPGVGTFDVAAQAISDATTRGKSPAHSERERAPVNAVAVTNRETNSDLQKYLAAPEEENKKKRRSFTSFLSRSHKEDGDSRSMSPSQEALVFPEISFHHSRASSLAATLDFENEKLELPTVAANSDVPVSPKTPAITVSPTGYAHASDPSQPQPGRGETVSFEPELEEGQLDLDPEEFVRPIAEDTQHMDAGRKYSSDPSSTTKRQSGSEIGTDILFEGTSKSRAATSVSSYSEVLTKGALDQMPSQLSNVVLSYRTNEWAKHISTADVPLVEEPRAIAEDEEHEPPVHLADPTTPVESKRSSLNQVLPPQIVTPIPSVVPSGADGIRINPAVQPEQPIVSAVVKPAPVHRSRSASEGGKAPHSFRSTSTPMLVKQPLQAISIDENTAAEFGPRHGDVHSVSPQPSGQLNATHLAIANRPTTAVSNHGGLARSGSQLSMVSENGMGIVPARSLSQTSNHQLGPYQHHPYRAGLYQPGPSRSETRLQSYDSHQPLRRNTSVENQRREEMFTNWRATQQRTPDLNDHAEMHRQQMLQNRQQMKMMEEHEKNQRWQQELVADVRMRSRDMQELHREAMRRMQSGANKKLNH